MSTQTMPSGHSAGAHPRQWAALPLSGALWGGLALVAMWLAVLFVGVFGGDIVSSSPGGSTSSVPVVVVVAIAAVLGTVSVGRWAFGSGRADEGDLRSALEDDRRAIDQLSQQIEDLRRELPGRAGAADREGPAR